MKAVAAVAAPSVTDFATPYLVHTAGSAGPIHVVTAAANMAIPCLMGFRMCDITTAGQLLVHNSTATALLVVAIMQDTYIQSKWRSFRI